LAKAGLNPSPFEISCSRPPSQYSFFSFLRAFTYSYLAYEVTKNERSFFNEISSYVTPGENNYFR
jgi:hypothetical protein